MVYLGSQPSVCIRSVCFKGSLISYTYLSFMWFVHWMLALGENLKAKSSLSSVAIYIYYLKFPVFAHYLYGVQHWTEHMKDNISSFSLQFLGKSFIQFSL